MSGREVREYTNLTDPKDRKWGKGKERIDEEDITFQRMVAKMQEVAGERGGYLHGRGALDSDDLLYLKEQMEAEEDAERLLRRTEKRAFAAFKRAAILADSSPSVLPLPLRVEPKPKSGIRQQDLLKNVLEIRPKRHRVSSPTDVKEKDQSSATLAVPVPKTGVTESITAKVVSTSAVSKGEASEALTPEVSSEQEKVVKSRSDAKSLLGLSYESSDEED